jgi:hypothetical protein
MKEELKEKWKRALDHKLALPHCGDCVRSRNFVQVVEFLIDNFTIAVIRMDQASQTMEDFIELFKEIEISEMKARMRGEDDL